MRAGPGSAPGRDARGLADVLDRLGAAPFRPLDRGEQHVRAHQGGRAVTFLAGHHALCPPPRPVVLVGEHPAEEHELGQATEFGRKALLLQRLPGLDHRVRRPAGEQQRVREFVP